MTQPLTLSLRYVKLATMFKPEYRITPYLLNLIDEASYLRSWIDHTPLRVSWLPVLQKEARAQIAHSSTYIEGNPLTLHQVKAIDRGEKIAAYNQHEKEVSNYLKAMRWISSNKEKPINEESLLQLHKIITDGLIVETKQGRYKEKQNYVMDEKGIKCYTPPSPRETPSLVRELLDWLNSPETQQLHTVLTSAIFHHRLVSIHPFSDGNGRLARAICTFILYKRDFDLHNIFSLDAYFADDLRRYYQKIIQARELDDNLTYWIEYVAEGVKQTLKDTRQRIEDLQVTANYQIQLSPRQEEALRILRDTHFVRASEFPKTLKVTRARLNQILTPLIKGGLVKKEGASRATIYKLHIH